jgi:hypothetical protein
MELILGSPKGTLGMGNQRAYRALAVPDSLVGLTISDSATGRDRLVKHMASNPDEVPKKSGYR